MLGMNARRFGFNASEALGERTGRDRDRAKRMNFIPVSMFALRAWTAFGLS